MHLRLALSLTIVLAAFVSSPATAAKFTADKSEAGVVVKVDGNLFTEYVINSNTKPILWPLIGPTGKAMTRAYPMKPGVAGEKQDHPHHRSFWFTHGKVNEVDFWDENPARMPGKTVHKKFAKIEAGDDRAVIVSENDWLAHDGRKVCEDQRTLTFGADGKSRWIDFDILIKATNGKLTFGDTKEGTFGVRIPTTMDVNSKLGGKIVNSEGLTDDAAWGKPASWCDYHGPVEGETLGIAILNHPVSYGYPTHWHVRTYGLFTANPFGLKSFDAAADPDGTHSIESGETLRLRYRVLLHSGDEKQGQVAESFAAFSKSP